MEQRGINIAGAGVEAVNTSLMIADPTAEGNQRVWSDVDKKVTVKHDATRGWIITSHDQSKIYYTESNTSNTYTDPWSVTYALGTDGLSPTPSMTSFDDPNIHITIGEPVTETDPETGDKITKTTTTVYNAVTNDRFVSVQTERERYNYVTTPVERYDTVNLTLGKVYRFTFVKDFEDLGYISDTKDENYSVMRGIYRVDKILSYKDVISNGIDVYNNLYVPSGVPKAVYTKDEPTFQNTMFYKLVDPRNEDIVLYMPLSFISGTPDGSIAKYDKLLMSINLGVFSSTEMIADMIDIIKELLKARWGIYADGDQFPEDMELVQFQRYDSLWLTTEDYDLIDKARQEVISDTSSTLLDKLFGSEMNKLKSENQTLKAKISAYEDIITNRT